MADPQPALTARLIQWGVSHRRALLVVLFWLSLIVLTRQVMQANDLTFTALIEQLQSLLTGAWYGPLLYIGVYLIRPVVLFPAWLLTVLGGNTFGLAAGFIFVLLGGTLSALIPFLIGRSFTSGETSTPAEDTRLSRFVGVLRRNPFQAVLVMRLLYLPYDGVSILAGTLRIPVLAFFAATAVGNVGGTLSFVGIGASLEGRLSSGELSVNAESLVFSFAILIVSFGLSYILNRINSRRSLAAVTDEVNSD